MKTKFMFISCILALVMSATVWAEGPDSPQKASTVDLTSTEADQFMSTTDWGNVSFNKAFTYVGYAQGKDHLLDLGAAFKAGPVYIGTWYQGNLGVFDGSRSESVTTIAEEGIYTGTLGNTRRSTVTKDSRSYDADHTAAVLIGYGNMGFQLGYKRSGKNKSGKYYNKNAESDSKETNTIWGGGVSSGTDITYDPKGFVNNATHTPFIAFGMNIPVGAMTISPTAALEINVAQDSDYGLKTEEAVNNKSKSKYQIDKEAKGNNASYVGITGKLGTGLALGDSLNSFVNINYDFTVNAYGKTYKDTAFGEKHKVKGSYKITTDSLSDAYNNGTGTSAGKHIITKTFNAEMTEKSYFSNTLTPGYSLQKDFSDRLSLFAGVECPITVTAETDVVTSENKKVTVTKVLDPSKLHDGTTVTEVSEYPTKTVNTTTLEVKPVATAAVSYAAIPNRLSLSVGTKIAFLKSTYTYKKNSYDKFVSTKKTTMEYDDGRRPTVSKTVSSDPRTESVASNSSHEQVSAELKGGLKWNIAENFIFDVGYTKSLLDPINVTNIGNLQLACTIKF